MTEPLKKYEHDDQWASPFIDQLWNVLYVVKYVNYFVNPFRCTRGQIGLEKESRLKKGKGKRKKEKGKKEKGIMGSGEKRRKKEKTIGNRR
jgi:hypothetical protein